MESDTGTCSSGPNNDHSVRNALAYACSQNGYRGHPCNISIASSPVDFGTFKKTYYLSAKRFSGASATNKHSSTYQMNT